jgi:hypothetical protein
MSQTGLHVLDRSVHETLADLGPMSQRSGSTGHTGFIVAERSVADGSTTRNHIPRAGKDG